MDHVIDGKGVERLARYLEQVPAIRRGLPERTTASARAAAWELATGLADIQQSCEKLFSDVLPRLLATEPNSEEAEDLLIDIGEEFRHILYHIMNNEFFAYVVPPKDSE